MPYTPRMRMRRAMSACPANRPVSTEGESALLRALGFWRVVWCVAWCVAVGRIWQVRDMGHTIREMMANRMTCVVCGRNRQSRKRNWRGTCAALCHVRDLWIYEVEMARLFVCCYGPLRVLRKCLVENRTNTQAENQNAVWCVLPRRSSRDLGRDPAAAHSAPVICTH